MEKIKVLLVDDEEDFVKALAERMKIRDLGSEIALNGEKALEIVQDEVPDVMVLDLRMPGIDGMEVLRRVKKAYPQVQVIILTGHGSDKDEKEARKLGAYEYLQKPVDIDVLVKTLRKAYKRKMEDAMVAATFAEAGDFKTAKEVLEEEKKKKS
jgi:DNA-binding NtrC family response regulator